MWLNIYVAILVITLTYYIYLEYGYKKEKQYEKILYNSNETDVIKVLKKLDDTDKLVIRNFIDDLNIQFNPKKEERNKFLEILTNSLITMCVSYAISKTSIDSWASYPINSTIEFLLQNTI